MKHPGRGWAASDPEGVRLRLRILPRALGFGTQTAFAQHLGIGISHYNNAILTGVLSKQLAFTIYRRHPDLRLEWLWFGDRMWMREPVLQKLDAAMKNGGGA